MHPRVLYFHGLPGSAAELAGFGPETAARCADFHVVARDSARPADGPAYFAALAERIATAVPEGDLRLVGFSLGAATALQVAPHLGQRVVRIDLVSPAGPLQLGDFLGGMAGAPVFRAALAGRLPFAMLTAAQAQVTRFAPRKLAAALMAKARGADRALASDPQFLGALATSLRRGLIAARPAYTAEICAYVADWTSRLANVRQPVAIWQGDADDWTPPAMAHALAAALPERLGVTMLPGLSHFSTLRAYLEAEASA